MNDLSPSQVVFIAKYLKVVPKPGLFKRAKTRTTAEQHNAKTEADYRAWLAAKTAFGAIRDEVEANLTTRRAAFAAIPKEALTDEVNAVRETIEANSQTFKTRTQAMVKLAVDVAAAPADEPLFESGTRQMTEQTAFLEQMNRTLPEIPALVRDGVLGALFRDLEYVTRMSRFVDVRGLTLEAAEMPLTDPVCDDRRANAKRNHDAACKAASDRITELITQASRPPQDGDDHDTLVELSRRRVAELEAELDQFVTIIRDAVTQSASGTIAQLATWGSPIAARELERSAIISARVTAITDQITKLDTALDALKDAHAAATGAGAKRDAAAEYHDAQAHREKLAARKRRLLAYESEMALHAGKISDAEIALKDFQYTPVEALAKLMEGFVVPENPDEIFNRDMLLAEPDSKTGSTGGEYHRLKGLFEGAVKRKRLNAKIFPGEPELTYIDNDQYDVLIDIIEQAKTLAEQSEDNYARAQFMFKQAEELYGKFLIASDMPLPDAVEAPLTEIEKLGRRLTQLGVDLDRFWGRGGDALKTLRDALDGLNAQYATALEADDDVGFDVAQLVIDTEAFAADLAREIAAFVPPDVNEVPRQQAKDTRNNINKALLDLYRTKELQIAELATVPPEKVLIIHDGDTKKYYQIETKHDGTLDRRTDKKVPREAMDLLLQQSTMLGVLAENTAPDCDAAITAAVDEAAKWMDAVTKGGDTFKHIADQISACNELLAKKIFKEWIPEGLFELRTQLEDFKKDYATRYLPDDGKVKIDAILAQLTVKKTEAEALKESYKAANSAVEVVEKKLAGDSKAAKPNLAERLKALIQQAETEPMTLVGKYITAPGELDDITELVNNMKAALVAIKPMVESGGLEGPFKSRVKTARDKVETKSALGMAQGKSEAEAIDAEMTAALAKLDPNDAQWIGNERAFIDSLSSFIDGEKSAADAMKAAQDEVDAIKDEIKPLLSAIHSYLEILKPRLATYPEYKNIYDTLNTQFEAASAKDDPLDAIGLLRDNRKSVFQLRDELLHLVNVGSGKASGPNFERLQKALFEKFDAIEKHAATIAAQIVSKAGETTIEGDDSGDAKGRLVLAAGRVETTLGLVTKANFNAILTIDPAVIAAAKASLTEENADTRKAMMAQARERALTEVRRIRKQTDNHKALQVYRDNPFSNQAWAGFAGALHSMDVDILKHLKPA